ncbi:N-acetylmuramoyl-L-alanine amidase [Fusobacterium sp. PH5-44]|uniref:N-acetylmuramoyl-L-alanine amidase n=1 Tax=unclassified Fusobacterium TaxID=2648384 RepID=UPI003D19D987
MIKIFNFILLFIFSFSYGFSAYEEESYFNQYGYPSVFTGHIGDYSDDFTIDNKSFESVGQDGRIKFIILHYTATGDELGKRALTYGNVSAHYLVTTDSNEPIFSLVHPDNRSWHAGVSEFYGRANLNDTSIGIEIVNAGMVTLPDSPPKNIFFRPYEEYLPYTENQIKKVAYLVKNLAKAYDIEPKFILGHSDIAPSRKFDPGPKFPWEHLYKEYGIGAWYNENDKLAFMKEYDEDLFKNLTVKEIKNEFYMYGYRINNTSTWDQDSRCIIYAFQMHFNPKTLTGEMDLETFAILKALNKKYSTRNLPEDRKIVKKVEQKKEEPKDTKKPAKAKKK